MCCLGRTSSPRGRQAALFQLRPDESGFAPDFQAGYTLRSPAALGRRAQIHLQIGEYRLEGEREHPLRGLLHHRCRPADHHGLPRLRAISLAKIELKQFALIPTIGRSFGKVTLYAGSGHALFDVETKFINVVGFAVIGGTPR
jgi:hypothetical protein